MDIERIIGILRESEHEYEGDGFPEEAVFSDSSIVLELDHDQDKLYTAILKTIPKEILAESVKEIRKEPNVAVSLVRKMEWMSEDHPRKEKTKNASLSSLLKLYINKKSKRVQYARQCIKDRFDKQSYRDQNRILRAFLSGPAMDCDWAGRILRDSWRKEMKGHVGEAWVRTRRQILAYVILRHFPNSFILLEQESLSDVAGYQFVCARLGNEPSFFLDESRLTTPNLFYVMAKLGRTVDSEEMEKKLYDFLLNYDSYYDQDPPTPSFSCISGWDRMVWAMGILGMQDSLIRLLEFENKVKASQLDDICSAEVRWPHFVTAIKDGIDPGGVPDRLEREIQAFKAKHGLPESHIIPNHLLNGEEIQASTDSETDDDLKQRAWYFNDELSKNPFMTMQEEWALFVESFFYDRPRLQAVLSGAKITEEMGFYCIEISVKSKYHEEWLRRIMLNEIQETFGKLCSFSRNEYDIIMVIQEETIHKN
jgi:hypothetical protein